MKIFDDNKRRITRIDVFAAALVLLLALPFVVIEAGIVPPKAGGPLPETYYKLKGQSKDAFSLKHAWIAKAKRLKHKRDGILYEVGIEGRHRFLSSTALKGILRIPVVSALYADTPTQPIDTGELQKELFSGPWPTGTLSDYYREVSLSNFIVTGNVYDWIRLQHDESYYTGVIYQGLVPGQSKTGELIRECIDALDPSVDFGLYDNDGPDGIPNSGDDDGFVDVLIVAHSTIGAECSNTAHMWSHSWHYSSWPESGGESYQTNDPSANGGFIKVDDYIILPSLSCEGHLIEIGVFCHELGHTLGLPDLYDGYGGAGIGYWGLMGAGNWNTPDTPAHMCAWSKEQLGWIVPKLCDWHTLRLNLEPVEEGGDVVKLVLPTRRFRRRYSYSLGSYALICGYNEAEANVRGMPGSEGYGNGWNEKLTHQFAVDGDRPVRLRYSAIFDMESDYDFGCLLLERGASVDTIRSYTGKGFAAEDITLDDFLPDGSCTFSLSFVFLSDQNYSDEDGFYDSAPGRAFNIDNIYLSGGGLDYSCDFEEDAGGWRDVSPPAEYFLLANREPFGFDAHIPGTGLLIWHAENSIAYSSLGNTGGQSNRQTRGVLLEEADGRFNLITPESEGGNKGDRGDPFPGSSGNRLFASTTTPSSANNGGQATPVVVSNVSLYGGDVSAICRGGMPAPAIDSVSPDTVYAEADTLEAIDIRGSGVIFGAEVFLVSGSDTVEAEKVDWLGEMRVIAHFPLCKLYSGSWSVAVRSGDGQTAVLRDALFVHSLFSGVDVKAGIDFIYIKWNVNEPQNVTGSLLFRSMNGGRFVLLTNDTLRASNGAFEYRDYSVLPGNAYSYMIETFLEGGEERTLLLSGPFLVANLPFKLWQNYPNPFSLSTRIEFFVPSRLPVSVNIYDISGRLVKELGRTVYRRGAYHIDWTPRPALSSGVYLCVFRVGTGTHVLKLVYLK